MPGKNGFVNTFLSKFPENKYFILLEILNWWGLIVGSYFQFASSKSVATQYVVLFTPVPLGSTSGGSYPSYPASAGDSAMK